MLRRTLFALIALAALCGAAVLAVRTYTPSTLTAIRWEMDSPDFGGWSGIDVSADGETFVAVGDKGSLARGRLSRESGQLVAAQLDELRWIEGELGPWSTRFALDAEGISFEDPTDMLISYEGFPRVWRHREGVDLPERIRQDSAFVEMFYNRSLEAVATLPDGTILTLPELPEPPLSPETYPVFAHDGQSWSQPFDFARDGAWRAVGADLGPDGRLYLLERRFLGYGFMSRIRRFPIDRLEGVLEGDVLYKSPPGRHGNLEGIGIWRDDRGRLRALMVSDDNFLPLLRSELVELILPE